MDSSNNFGEPGGALNFLHGLPQSVQAGPSKSHHVPWALPSGGDATISPTQNIPGSQEPVSVPDFGNAPLFSFETAQDRQPKAVQSCVECRRRKIKCDRIFPCGPCKIRNEAHSCEEYVRSKTNEPAGYTLVADFRILASRVVQIEQFLKDVYGTSKSPKKPTGLVTGAQHPVLPSGNDASSTSAAWPGLPLTISSASGEAIPREEIDLSRLIDTLGAADGGLATIASGPNATFAGTMPYQSLGPVQISPKDATRGALAAPRSEQAIHKSRSQSPADSDHEAALALEDMALHRYQARTKTLISATPAFASRYLPPPALGHLLSLQSVLTTSRGRVLIPTREQFRLLTSDFVQRYLWIQRCVHAPSVQHDLETLLSSSAEMGGDMYFEPRFVPFLSLLMAVCATSMHFASIEDLQRYNMPANTQKKTCTDWTEATITLLHMSDWLQSHRLVCLQAVVILGPVLAATDRGEMHWSMLGSAIKVAQALNLGRLVPDTVLQGRSARKVSHVGLSAGTVLTREIGRRTWAMLVEEDWLFAPEHNYSYSIHPKQNLTAEVSNVNDSDLTLATELISLPESIWTESSYMISRHRMIIPFRNFTDACLAAEEPALKLIQECEAKLSQLRDGLPSFYQLDHDLSRDYSPQMEFQIRVERIAVHSGLHTRLLRVHRTGLRRAYRNEKYEACREACISSAKILLHLGEDWLSVNIPISGWWPVVYGIYSASVILFITMCRNTALAGDHEQRILRAVHIIRSLAGPLNMARDHMATTLERLLAGRRKRLGEATLESSIPAKRKHEGDSSTPCDLRMETFVNSLVEAEPTTSAGASDKPLSQSSILDFNAFHGGNSGEPTGALDYMFNFGEYDDPFADIMRMTEASLNSAVPGLWDIPVDIPYRIAP